MPNLSLGKYWCPQLGHNGHVTNEDTEISDHMTGREIMNFHKKQESDHVGPLAKELGVFPQDNWESFEGLYTVKKYEQTFGFLLIPLTLATKE